MLTKVIIVTTGIVLLISCTKDTSCNIYTESNALLSNKKINIYISEKFNYEYERIGDHFTLINRENCNDTYLFNFDFKLLVDVDTGNQNIRMKVRKMTDFKSNKNLSLMPLAEDKVKSIEPLKMDSFVEIYDEAINNILENIDN